MRKPLQSIRYFCRGTYKLLSSDFAEEFYKEGMKGLWRLTKGVFFATGVMVWVTAGVKSCNDLAEKYKKPLWSEHQENGHLYVTHNPEFGPSTIFIDSLCDETYDAKIKAIPRVGVKVFPFDSVDQKILESYVE